METPTPSTTTTATHTHTHHASSSSQAAGGIRSRITVVCAECKRLKLKCDRRTPCGSCQKRDTVPRCTYSAAAAEKIDVQSLHNRILLLEASLAQATSGGKFRSTEPNNDRALVAIGSSGSSVLVSLEEIAGVWAEQLDLLKDVTLKPAEPDLPTSRVISEIFPTLEMYRTSNSPYEALGVTPTLLKQLPSDPATRDMLLRQLEKTMIMHPSINFPHFRARINALFDDPPPLDRPTLSFFAAAAAGFALGALSWQEENRRSMDEARLAVSADNLWALSKQTLSVFEASSPPDLDSLVAMIMQTLFLLHDGKPRIDHTLFPLIGKMVNIARGMGLAVDPDEYGNKKYSVFEAEMRRRVWWDVYYYDLFVSDCMGMAPLIADDLHTCKPPSDVNDETFHPGSTSLPLKPDGPESTCSYFVQKCSLARLVKSMKKRTGRDPYRDCQSGELSIEAAMAMERDVTNWLEELPDKFKLAPRTEGTAPDAPPFLVAQRCELAAVANMLIIKLFHPFLKRSATRSPHHHAVFACADAAHAIIDASRALHSVSKTFRPAAYMFYSFGRQLFHAVVITACSVIMGPHSRVAPLAMEDVRLGISIMRDPLVSTGRGSSRGVEGAPSEALKVCEMLQAKAEAALAGGRPAVGSKRKHSEVDEHIAPGFHLPYVGGGVTTAQHLSDSVSESGSSRIRTFGEGSIRGVDHSERMSTNWEESSQRSLMHHGSTRERDRDRDRASTKSSKYPTVGFRNRTSTTSSKKSHGRARAQSQSGSIVAGMPTRVEIIQPSMPASHPAPSTSQPLPPQAPPPVVSSAPPQALPQSIPHRLSDPYPSTSSSGSHQMHTEFNMFATPETPSPHLQGLRYPQTQPQHTYAVPTYDTPDPSPTASSAPSYYMTPSLPYNGTSSSQTGYDAMSTHSGSLMMGLSGMGDTSGMGSAAGAGLHQDPHAHAHSLSHSPPGPRDAQPYSGAMQPYPPKTDEGETTVDITPMSVPSQSWDDGTGRQSQSFNWAGNNFY